MLSYQCLLQSASQLIGTRGALVPTTNALQLGNGLGCFHATHKHRDSLEVAMAAAQELYALYNALLVQFKIDL